MPFAAKERRGVSPLIRGLAALTKGLTALTKGLTPLTKGLTPLTKGLTPLTKGLTPWILASALVFSLSGCESNPLGDDLDDARYAMKKGEWLGAQKLLERYLRTATDLEQRWEAWNRLLEVSLKVNPDGNWMVDYLEIILMELENARSDLPPVKAKAVIEPTQITSGEPLVQGAGGQSPEKQGEVQTKIQGIADEGTSGLMSPVLLGEHIRSVLKHLAKVHETAGRYERAMEALNQLIEEPDLSAEQSVNVHRAVARMNTRMRRFTAAEETLQSCLSLPVNSGKQAECLYDLAELNASQDHMDIAAEYVQQVMDMDNVTPHLRALAGFMLADLKEQQGNLTKSLELFEEIHTTYPNGQVVEYRISALKKQLKKK